MNQTSTHRQRSGAGSPRGDGGRTLLPPRGLRVCGTSSLDLFYAERVRTEAGPALEGSRAHSSRPNLLLKGPPA